MMRAAATAGFLVLLVSCSSAGRHAQRLDPPVEARPTPTSAATLTNPLLPAGADPWVVHRDGFYYYTHTTGHNLTLWKTRNLADLARAERKVVWTPPPSGPYAHALWAPELHFLDGKWYLYFAADAGTNLTHRLWVLENGSSDPLLGQWVMKGKVADASDKWAIDGSVFEHNGQRYLVWSGWEGDENGIQHLYLARMTNPWTLEGHRVRLSTPTYPWEKVGDLTGEGDDPPHVDVNEGPQFLRHGDKVFLIYSASGCWTDHYALGMLTASASADLLDPASWVKSPRPVFASDPGAHAYGPGHNAFFQSPDGAEDWILYHANPEPGQGCGQHRSPRAQRFTWKADGTPGFGRPVPPGRPLPPPSGG